MALQYATFTRAQMHQVLRHVSPKVISYIALVGNDIIVDNSSPIPTTIEYETYSLSKVIEIISYWVEVEELENNIPFDCIT